MHLKHLTLRNFKNHEEIRLGFSEHVNCITGANGTGKTNILDAIYFLSFTKSFLIHQDQQLVQHGKENMLIEGNYEHDGIEQNIQVLLKSPGRKSFKVNNNNIIKLGTHIGSIPLVLIAPQDIWLLHEGSSERRRLMDMVLCQLDKVYFSQLNTYNKAIEQRNKLLKQSHESNTLDTALLESLDQILIPAASCIHQKRVAFIADFIPFVADSYSQISGGLEQVEIIYESELNKVPFESLLKKSLPKDQILQRTTSGIHKDDVSFVLNQLPMKTHASQGQQKTFIISLKMAVCSYIYTRTQKYPILLLDDIFEKLDHDRSTAFIEMATNKYPGQVFVTDTHIDRCKAAHGNSSKEVKYWEL